MPPFVTRFVALALALCLLADKSLLEACRPPTLFNAQALAQPLLSGQHSYHFALSPNPPKISARSRIPRWSSHLKSFREKHFTPKQKKILWREIGYVSLQVGAFIIAGHYYQAWAETWAQGPPVLVSIILFPISIAAYVISGVFKQRYEMYVDRPMQGFFDWSNFWRMVLMAVGYSALIEGFYYEVVLSLVPGTGTGTAAWRGMVDVLVSILWLEPVNLYVFKRWVDRWTHEAIMKKIRAELIDLYLLTGPLWFLIVVIANLLERPITNFIVINAGFVAWNSFYYVALEMKDIESRLWLRKHFNTLRKRLGRSEIPLSHPWPLPIRWWQALYDSHWFGVFLPASLFVAYGVYVVWLISPVFRN